MNGKVFILALSTIAAGLVELIVGGILPEIADDFHISLSSAGQLITVFALIYAIAGPVLLVLTAKIERKKLYLMTLFIFFLGNILTYFAPNFSVMMILRIISAMSTALIVVLSLTIAAKIVSPAHQAKALGLIYMGISSSLVLGVPVGILISNTFGWRIIFLGIAVVSIGSMILIALFLERIPGGKTVPLKTQLKAVASAKIGTAHLATLFMLAGHYTLYAYFTPFLETNLHLSSYWISICYFVFGIAAISGGAFGGSFRINWDQKSNHHRYQYICSCACCSAVFHILFSCLLASHDDLGSVKLGIGTAAAELFDSNGSGNFGYPTKL
ncbi:MFS transporter [Virgibacillus sp. 179-BFC.A HS]|uniref:MFS transporter n=1 Tax=Tigheibacillus jepli TaxID=3035914 RepID=A0ABU5CHW1_9BACI|nr:MFS transporter [Virgibacillus sp. 179-BFC.A HS]MDY0405937.1 MFS transporter [Virgibacillus sp. 179-BFC.A HS]